MKKLVNLDTIEAYMERYKKMAEVKFTPKGDDLFIENIVASARQIDNLQVESEVNGFIIGCDEPKALGGNDSAPRPIDLLLAALANCLEISALLFFSFTNLKVDSVKVSVKAKIDKRAMLDDKNAPLPGFSDFKIRWDIITEEKLSRVKNILNRVERFCPVSGTVSKAQDFQWIININP